MIVITAQPRSAPQNTQIWKIKDALKQKDTEKIKRWLWNWS